MEVFQGFANLSQRFNLRYSQIVARISKLTKKNVLWSWNDNKLAKTAFLTLKEDFTSVSILLHFNTDEEIVVETYLSNYVSAGVLSHPHSEGILNLVAFFFKKDSPMEYNFKLYDKQPLEII